MYSNLYLSLLEYWFERTIKTRSLRHVVFGAIISLIGMVMVLIKPLYLLSALLSDMSPWLRDIVPMTKTLVPEWMNALSGYIIIFSGIAYSLYWCYEWYGTLSLKKF